MNTMLNALKNETNFTYTENGAVSHKTTLSAVYDMFAFGGSYRSRSDEDCILLFKNAFEEDETLAMKCLFYLRDARGGAGERRFFRVVIHWLAKEHPEVVRRNMSYFAEYGRYDDLYVLVDTPLEKEMFNLMKHQIAEDIRSYKKGEKEGISLLAKWMKSINASSEETKKLGRKTAKALGMSQKEYRKLLSTLRKRINVLETLMSENRWDEITYETVPSKAGLQYRNAFAKHDAERYKAFIEDKHTKVKADVLTPVDIAHKAFEANTYWGSQMSNIERAALNKYWENQKDWYNGREENAIAVCDVSGSMSGIPMEAAVAMGAYIAERGKGPFANHFITFSRRPKLVKFEGIDIVDKFQRAQDAEWGYNTDIYAVMNLLLSTAVNNHIKPAEMPERLYVFTDMEFDSAFGMSKDGGKTLFEQIAEQWKKYGYELPHMVFWNLDARHNLIPMMSGRVSYVSGFTMAMMESILSGKDGIALMLDKLNSKRYEVIK